MNKTAHMPREKILMARVQYEPAHGSQDAATQSAALARISHTQITEQNNSEEGNMSQTTQKRRIPGIDCR
jgi:hypothetical protein